MMFLSSKRREKDGFQMTGAADAVFQSERVFMGQNDSFRAFGFILNCRHCAVSSAYHAVDRHLLPKTAGLLPPIWRDYLENSKNP